MLRPKAGVEPGLSATDGRPGLELLIFIWQNVSPLHCLFVLLVLVFSLHFFLEKKKKILLHSHTFYELMKYLHDLFSSAFFLFSISA